jgi:hypothetical protein
LSAATHERSNALKTAAALAPFNPAADKNVRAPAAGIVFFCSPHREYGITGAQAIYE